MARETYFDNNGFERDSITCKIVVKQHYSKEEIESTNELFNTFRTSRSANNNTNIDYLNYIEGRCINDTE